MTAAPEAPIKRTTVHGIREELRMLWASESMSDEAVIRARTHNLVVVVSDDVDAEETTRRVIERTGERPGRVIIVDIDHKHKTGLDAWVTTYCRSVNQHQICGEMITLTTSADQRGEVHSTVISLLAPDLPVYLWWSGLPDQEDHLFAHLAPEADRILVDSDTFDNAAAGYRAIVTMQKQYRIGDLAWGRLTPWRKLLAQLWDAPDMAAEFARFRSLDVTVHPAGPANPGRAALLLGWLSVRLGWAHTGTTSDEKGHSIRWMHANGEGGSVLAAAAGKDLRAGDIGAIEITAGEGKDAVRARLEIRPESSMVETTVERGGRQVMKNACQLRYTDDAMALAEELDLGYDPSYVAAVEAAAGLFHPGGHPHGK